jgi:hypothetical protein
MWKHHHHDNEKKTGDNLVNTALESSKATSCSPVWTNYVAALLNLVVNAMQIDGQVQDFSFFFSPPSHETCALFCASL